MTSRQRQVNYPEPKMPKGSKFTTWQLVCDHLISMDCYSGSLSTKSLICFSDLAHKNAYNNTI